MRINTGYEETCPLCGFNLQDSWCDREDPVEIECVDCGRKFLNWSHLSRLTDPAIKAPRFRQVGSSRVVGP